MDSTCDDELMSEDGDANESFQDRVKWIARELSRSVEHLAQLDVDEIARTIGVDAERARSAADSVGRWLGAHGEAVGSETFFGEGESRPPASGGADRRGVGPQPLDLPSESQGLALSALDSGRWTVEPGSNLLLTHGEGPAPGDGLGLVGELRARDWIDSGGEVTLLGRRALSRWSDTAQSE